MRMNVAQEADATVASAKGLVDLFGPTSFKAHPGTEEEASFTNKPVRAYCSWES